MSGRRGKRKRSMKDKTASPLTKRTLSPKTPTTANPSSSKNKTRMHARSTEEQHTPPRYQTTSSLPKTPNTPSGTKKLSLNKSTAKSLLKHGSKITPLYNMLYGFGQMVMEAQPKSEEEVRPLLDQLAGQLVSLPLRRSFFLVALLVSFSFYFFFPVQSLTSRIPSCLRGRPFRRSRNAITTPCAKSST
jgi:hypothetical protein